MRLTSILFVLAAGIFNVCPLVSQVAPVEEESPQGPSVEPASNPAAEDEANVFNQSIGMQLLSDTLLWDDELSDVAQRLSLKKESGAEAMASYRGRLTFAGIKTASTILNGKDGKPLELILMFANKGDSLGMAPDKDSFEDKKDYKEALERFDEKKKNLEDVIKKQADDIEVKLTEIMGKPARRSFGKAAAKENVKAWMWKDHAFLMAENDEESLAVRVVSLDRFESRGTDERIGNSDLKAMLKSRVERRENGDVIVTGIPMINQGQKGYCVPSTWARYMRYVGITVDEYVLANAAGTEAGGGTSTSAMASAAGGILSKNGRDLKKVGGKTSIRLIQKYIDDGLPLMWTMYSVGAFEGGGGKAGRMKGMTPEEYEASLKERRKEDKKIEIDKDRGHVCMIIGYNPITGEICTSDSWGPSHAEKWYTEEAVQAVSRDEHFIIKW